MYPGARRKEGDDDDQEKSANVNISSSLFGLKVVAIEYLSDDPPDKACRLLHRSAKKYGSVLECHTNKTTPGREHESGR